MQSGAGRLRRLKYTTSLRRISRYRSPCESEPSSSHRRSRVKAVPEIPESGRSISCVRTVIALLRSLAIRSAEIADGVDACKTRDRLDQLGISIFDDARCSSTQTTPSLTPDSRISRQSPASRYARRKSPWVRRILILLIAASRALHHNLVDLSFLFGDAFGRT